MSETNEVDAVVMPESVDPTAFLYKTDRMKEAFLDAFVGPDVMPHMQEVRVAKYSSAGMDGNDVEVYATSAPSTVFKIKALPSKDSCGNDVPPFTLKAGSGQLHWTAKTSLLICEGMISA